LAPFSGVMKPKPLASLNHFTVPVVRIAELLLGVSRDGRRPPTGETQKGPRESEGPCPSAVCARSALVAL
jgi:hypothetical protein